MAIASGVMSGAQAINNFQKAKKAEKQAMVLGNQMNAMKIKDAYASLQAPDIATAQYNETMRQASQATQALQGMGPEGAGQIANLNQSILQQNAQTTADQAALNYDRDRAVAEGRNQNAQYEYNMQMQNLQNRIEGAQGAATAGRQNAMSAVAGGIEGIGAGLAYDYGNSDKVWGKEKTTETPTQKTSVEQTPTEQIKTLQDKQATSNLNAEMPTSMWADKNKRKNLTYPMDIFSYPSNSNKPY
jgi:hypothetical protein